MEWTSNPDEFREKWALAEGLPDFARALALWSSPALAEKHQDLAGRLFERVCALPLSRGSYNLQMSRMLTLLDMALAASARAGKSELILRARRLWASGYRDWQPISTRWAGDCRKACLGYRDERRGESRNYCRRGIREYLLPPAARPFFRLMHVPVRRRQRPTVVIDKPGQDCDKSARMVAWRAALPSVGETRIGFFPMPPDSSPPVFSQRHLLGIEHLSRPEIEALLDLSDEAVAISRQVEKKRATLRGRTQINLFFEASTRTQSSFELAGKRLGADVMNMAVGASSVKKGETLIDTAMTLNAMRPDILVVRHHAAGRGVAAGAKGRLLGDQRRRRGARAPDPGAARRLDHPPQSRPDRGPDRRHLRRHSPSRVARSNILLLGKLGAYVRVVGPSTLLPAGVEQMGVEVCRDMRSGLKDADIVMMLRLQRERMSGASCRARRNISAISASIRRSSPGRSLARWSCIRGR